jgi:hypothetical protein
MILVTDPFGWEQADHNEAARCHTKVCFSVQALPELNV